MYPFLNKMIAKLESIHLQRPISHKQEHNTKPQAQWNHLQTIN